MTSIDPDNSNAAELKMYVFRFPPEFELSGFYCIQIKNH